jgi:DNA-binding transcriptional ArsR family regulator
MPRTRRSRPSDVPERSASDEGAIRDPRALRALTHPVRIALLETLAMHGPLTATRAGELIGESGTTCSFHLRQLAKYGFVTDAGVPGTRERPWRLSRFGLHFAERDTDPDTRAAAAEADQALREHYLTRLKRWYETRERDHDHWGSATGQRQVLLYVTPDELRALDADLMALLLRHADRLTDPARRPPDSAPVEVLAFIHPIGPPRDQTGET